MKSVVSKTTCYFSYPRVERPESSENINGTQAVLQFGYIWIKIVWLWYARGQTLSDSEISQYIQDEFYPGSDYVLQSDPHPQQEHPSLDLCHYQLTGMAYKDSYPGYGSMPSYFSLPPSRIPKYVQKPLLDGGQKTQLMGYHYENRYRVIWAEAGNQSASELTRIIHDLFWPNTNYIFNPSSILTSLSPIIEKDHRFTKFNCMLSGKYLGT